MSALPMPETTHQRSSLPRRVAGAVVAAAVVIGAACFVLALWNPWDLVVLERHFGNPLFGAFAIGAGGYLALWLLLPVRNEAVQRGRLVARVFAAVLALVGLFAWGLLGRVFSATWNELAHSASGDRTVVLRIDDADERQFAELWQGTGLLARRAGEFGRVCGGVRAEFLDEDRVQIEAGYGPWEFDLDPETGEPQQVLGPRCPDPPEPR